MILHSLNGHLIPVKDTGGPGGFSLGLLKNLRKMLHLPGTTFFMACLLCLIHCMFWWNIPIKQEAGLLGYLSDIMSIN